MTKLPRVGSRALIRVLRKLGFQRTKFGRGSHQSYVKVFPDGRKVSVTVVEGKKELPTGTLAAILDRAEITTEQFHAALKE